jgi:hypothetical protein
MTARRPATRDRATRYRGPSRRGFLGGALAATLAAALLPADRVVSHKPRWEQTRTRWIGHW